jgi:hypothetical protein
MVMVTLTKTTRRLQECKCRSYDNLGKPGTLDGMSRVVRYKQDGLPDTKMDTVMATVTLNDSTSTSSIERETGNG